MPKELCIVLLTDGLLDDFRSPVVHSGLKFLSTFFAFISYLCGTVDCVLLHLLGHVRIFDYCFSIRHFDSNILSLAITQKYAKYVYTLLVIFELKMQTDVD